MDSGFFFVRKNKKIGGKIMITTEFVQNIIDEKQGNKTSKDICEASAYEIAQLLCGSFIYPLYGALWIEHCDLDSITEHLTSLHESDNHYGLIYFIVLLADMVEHDIPLIYSQMSASDKYVPILSATIIEDWIEYHETSEVIDVS